MWKGVFFSLSVAFSSDDHIATLSGPGAIPRNTATKTAPQLAVLNTSSPSKGCTPPGSLPPDCSKCLDSSQCGGGGYCCPFMKKCVKSSSQSCYYPIANCRPPCMGINSCNCQNKDFPLNWAAPTCSGPDPSPTPAPPGPSDDFRGSCLESVNKYRALAGKGPLTLCSDVAQNTAQAQSVFDAANGPHNWVRTKGWGGMCQSASTGQCEAMGATTQDQAIQMYYNEGPGGGHYDIMMNEKNGCVACGYCTGCSTRYNRYYTHNFCVAGGLENIVV